MSGVAKNYDLTQIVQGPADLWLIPTAYVPSDSALRLVLASDLSPDSVSQPGCIHLGATATAITTGLKPKIANIVLDQYDAPVDGFTEMLEATIEAEMAQTTSELLGVFLGVGTYSQASGVSDQLTFGGNLVVPTYCIAAISPARENPLLAWVSILYQCVSTGGIQVTMGRKKPSYYKAKFQGLASLTRSANQNQGIIYKTLANASGGTPTSKNYNTSQIWQGQADLWWVSPAPTDTAQTVTLDATALTPSASVHANSIDFGLATGPAVMTVTPKLSFFNADQFDAPVGAFIDSLDAKLEAELEQAGAQNLLNALGLGAYTLSAGNYSQLTFGLTNQPQEICIAAIGVNRNDATKASVMALYKTLAEGGITLTLSRKKTNTYKAQFTGIADVTRTAGRTIGYFFEMTGTPGAY
ncbi:MAG: hypothetical protein KGL39_11505 [Patescibacteria group bacterium]|nr:hypothetical protein [Patescibacteria group bacterium]